jgi:hypothetical protein
VEKMLEKVPSVLQAGTDCRLTAARVPSGGCGRIRSRRRRMRSHLKRTVRTLLSVTLLGSLVAVPVQAAQDAPPLPAETDPEATDLAEPPAARDPWVTMDLGIGDDRGLSLAIEPLASEETPHRLLVRLENSGHGDEVVLLGHMLGGGRAQIPSKLEMEVTGRNGNRTTFHYAHPERLVVGGTLHPMVVPILAQGRYECVLVLQHFMTAEEGSVSRWFEPPEGSFEVSLRLQGTPPFQKEDHLSGLFLWSGDVRSNVLVFGAEDLVSAAGSRIRSALRRGRHRREAPERAP